MFKPEEHPFRISALGKVQGSKNCDIWRQNSWTIQYQSDEIVKVYIVADKILYQNLSLLAFWHCKWHFFTQKNSKYGKKVTKIKDFLWA